MKASVEAVLDPVFDGFAQAISIEQRVDGIERLGHLPAVVLVAYNATRGHKHGGKAL
jgi:hypothetical protein